MTEKFSKPDVPRKRLQTTLDILNKTGPQYPWDLIETIETKCNCSKKEARKAVRQLKIEQSITPAGDFVGKIKATRNSPLKYN